MKTQTFISAYPTLIEEQVFTHTRDAVCHNCGKYLYNRTTTPTTADHPCGEKREDFERRKAMEKAPR